VKRPQGFDRTAAASSAAVPRAEETATLGTEPEPVAPAQECRAPRAAPEAFPAGASPYDRLPSNREIGKALRAARKERRRLERAEVRRFTRRSRRRKQVWTVAGAVVGALVLGVVLVGFSPLLALKNIEVTDTERLDPKVIRQKLDDQLGRPLPLLDQTAISRDLAAFPLIRSYSLESRPPDTIVVRVVERQPIGAIQQGSAFTLVDAAKVPISSTQTRPEGMPLIAASGPAADANADSGFAAAAGALSALPADVRAQVDTITAKTKDDVSFTLRGSGATVVWGSADDSALKAADLAALLKSVPGNSRYDVSSPHSVTTG
jgi:cell division protein FtsQ